MTSYYPSINDYLKNFDINHSIIDTKERDKMCEIWQKLAYSPIYLIFLSYDPDTEEDYWVKEETYWTGWEWNEKNNHIHGIGTMKNLYDENIEQVSHMVFNLSFNFILSKKRLENLKINSNDEVLNGNIDTLLKYKTFNFNFFGDFRKHNNNIMPGLLEIDYPKIDKSESY